MSEQTPDIALKGEVATPDFFIIPAVILYDESLQPLDAIVYGVVYWFERMRDGYCRASNGTIAKVARSSSSGVAHSLQRLRDSGHITCEYDDKNNRLAIVTLVHFSKRAISNEQAPPISNEQHNNKNSKKEDKYIPEIERLYTLYIIRHKIDPHKLDRASDSDKRSLLDAAKRNYKLTDKRKAKLVARIEDAGPEMVAKAIINVSKSGWHMGENPDSKKYNDLADFICRSYEQVENWANKEGL